MGIFNRRRAAAEIARKVAEEVEREVAREASRNAEMLRGAELLRDVARRMQATAVAQQAEEQAKANAQAGAGTAEAADEQSTGEQTNPQAAAAGIDGTYQTKGAQSGAQADEQAAQTGTQGVPAGASAGAPAGAQGAADPEDLSATDATDNAALDEADFSSASNASAETTESPEDTIPDFPAELAEALARNAAKMQAHVAGGSMGSDEMDPSHMGESSPAVSSPEVTVLPEPTDPDQDAPVIPGEEPPAPQPIVPVASVQTDEQGEVTSVPAPAPRKSMPMPVEGRLGSSVVRVPPEIRDSSGIMVNGRRLKSFAYSTDVAVIHNTNADAILAVYPFTGHPQIMKAVQSVAKAPVFTGVGGGTTTGQRVLELAMFAEMQGMMGVVLNAPSPVETVERVVATVDIPVVVTVLEWDDFARAKVEAGARIVNVAAGKHTVDVVRAARKEYPDLPIIATGGNSPESIHATIEAGANALSWTPPSAPELQGMMMDQYRDGYANGETIGHAPGGEHGAHAADASSQRLSAWLSDKEL